MTPHGLRCIVNHSVSSIFRSLDNAESLPKRAVLGKAKYSLARLRPLRYNISVSSANSRYIIRYFGCITELSQILTVGYDVFLVANDKDSMYSTITDYSECASSFL